MELRKAGLGRWWRGALVVLLCGLIYYISFDHGRASLQLRMEERERRMREERDQLLGEMLRLRARLTACLAPGEVGGRSVSGRMPLKANQSKTLFDGRLVVSVLAIDSEAGRARVQLNFMAEERLAAEDLAVGASLRFRLGGRDWAVVLDSLTLTTANLHLTELKPD